MHADIEQGMGMIADARNSYTAGWCPVNSYGASARVYGLTSAPCKPCPRNMITNGLAAQSTMDACINDDGFGYTSEGASRCAPGFYAAKGSRRPCTQCPAGRSTNDTAALQRTITDCWVLPGFGVVNSTRNSSNPFTITISGLSATQQANMPVAECPVGGRQRLPRLTSAASVQAATAVCCCSSAASVQAATAVCCC
jgi:hypothetical protein